MSEDWFQLTPEQLEELRREPEIISTTRYEPCLCGKVLDLAKWQRKWYSGEVHGKRVIVPGVNYTDLLCGDCRKEFKGWPRLVCLKCKSLMGFHKAGRQFSGFVFESGKHYHMPDCPRCSDKPYSSVLEHDAFCKDQNIPIKIEHDLVQEIKQKTLQGQREAAKLREEFQNLRSKTS